MIVSPPPQKPPRRVAILRLSSAGDIVLTSGALESLKRAWPETELFYVTKGLYRPLIEHSPHLAGVLPWTPEDTVSSMKQRLVSLGIDAIVDLHNSQRTRLLRLLMPGVPGVVWQKRPWSSSLSVRLGLTPYRPTMTIAARYHNAVEALVGSPLPRGHLQYHLGPNEIADSLEVLKEAKLDLKRPIVGVSPGAKWYTKRWPARRFGELISRVLDQGFECIITGSDDELPLAHQIQESAPQAVNLVGKVPFALLGGVLSHCSAFIANDSGPMHIARGLGVPTLAFFGSTAPEQFHSGGHAFLFTEEPCAPCHFYGRKSCPKKHLNCLKNISTDDAWEALGPLLNGERRPFLTA